MSELPLLDAPENVLSTLRGDGSRRWLRPRLSTGRWWKRRRTFAYALIIFFVVLPHLRFAGLPLVLLDIRARRFIFLGHTFLPTDTLLLALVMLTVFVTIVLATAFVGRVWCGWACPQTVYMEFLFRPIDRLFEGTTGKGGKPKREITGIRRIARWGVYLLLSMLLANTFLAYFVGTDQLAQWILGSPINHPVAFVVMGVTTGLMMFDFLFFREQLCLIACPYGRFQSVMLDRQSLIVAYDPGRGEPRKKGKHTAQDQAGDCVDCNQCVVVCPTGIDIRHGLQLECINCTQCIDACDNVMDRVGTDRGLIRYTSQDALAGKPPKLLRLRTIAYPTLLTGLIIAFVLVLSTKYAFDARLIRGAGNLFYRNDDGTVTNTFRLRLDNRSTEPHQYTVNALDPANAVVKASDDGPIELPGNGTTLVPLTIKVKAGQIDAGGRRTGKILIKDDIGNERTVSLQLLGPTT